MAEPCSCEEAMALRAENEGLKTAAEEWFKERGIMWQNMLDDSRERDQLRELARELVAVAERIGTDADLWIEGEQLLARARALGVEVGR